jgi:hypothetical protein
MFTSRHESLAHLALDTFRLLLKPDHRRKQEQPFSRPKKNNINVIMTAALAQHLHSRLISGTAISACSD